MFDFADISKYEENVAKEAKAIENQAGTERSFKLGTFYANKVTELAQALNTAVMKQMHKQH